MKEQHSVLRKDSTVFDNIALLQDKIFSMSGILYPDELAKHVANANSIAARGFDSKTTEILQKFLSDLQLVADYISIDNDFIKTMKRDKISQQALFAPIEELVKQITALKNKFGERNKKLSRELEQIILYYDTAVEALKKPKPESDEWKKHSVAYARISDGKHYYLLDQRVAKKLLCINEKNEIEKKNSLGLHTVSHWGEIFFKSHTDYHPIDPAKEFLANSKSYHITGKSSCVTPTWLVKISNVSTEAGPQSRLLQASLEVKGPSLGFLVKAYDMVQILERKFGKEKLSKMWDVLSKKEYVNAYLDKKGFIKANEKDSIEKRKDRLLKSLYEKVKKVLEQTGDFVSIPTEELSDKISKNEKCWAYLRILESISRNLSRKGLPRTLYNIMKCDDKQGQLNRIGPFIYPEKEDQFFSALALLATYPSLVSNEIVFEDILLWPSLLDYINNKLFSNLEQRDVLEEMLSLMNKFDMVNFAHHGIDGLVSKPDDGKGDNIHTSIVFNANGKIETIRMSIIDADGLTQGNILKLVEKRKSNSEPAKKMHYAAVKFLPFSIKELMQREIPIEFWCEVQKHWQYCIVGFLKDCHYYNEHIRKFIEKRIIIEEDISRPAMNCGEREKNMDPYVSVGKRSFIEMIRIMSTMSTINSKHLAGKTITMAYLFEQIDPILFSMYNYANILSEGVIHAAFSYIFHEEFDLKKMAKSQNKIYSTEVLDSLSQSNEEIQWTPEQATEYFILQLLKNKFSDDFETVEKSTIFETLCKIAPEKTKKLIDFSQFGNIKDFFDVAVNHQFNNFVKILLEQANDEYLKYIVNSKFSPRDKKDSIELKAGSSARASEEHQHKIKRSQSSMPSKIKKRAISNISIPQNKKSSPRASEESIPVDYSYLPKCCNEEYLTPLMIACQQANIVLIEYFQSYFKEKDINQDKETVFHLLLRNFSNHPSIVLKGVEYLSEKSSMHYLNVQNKKEETALHILFQQCSNEEFKLEEAIKIVDLLLKQKANAELKNSHHLTAIDIVVKHYFELLKNEKYRKANKQLYEMRIKSNRINCFSDSYARDGFINSLENYGKKAVQLPLDEKESNAIKVLHKLASLFFFLVENGCARNAKPSKAYYFIKSLFSGYGGSNESEGNYKEKEETIKENNKLRMDLLKKLASDSQSMRWFLALFALVEEEHGLETNPKNIICSPTLGDDYIYSLKPKYQDIILNQRELNKKNISSLGKVTSLLVENELGEEDEIYVTDENESCSKSYFAFSFLRRLSDGLANSEEPFSICDGNETKYYHFYHRTPGESLESLEKTKGTKTIERSLSNIDSRNYTFLYLSLLLLNLSNNTTKYYNAITDNDSGNLMLTAVGNMEAFAAPSIIFDKFSKPGLESIIFLLKKQVQFLDEDVVNFFLSTDMTCLIQQVTSAYNKIYRRKTFMAYNSRHTERLIFSRAYEIPLPRLLSETFRLQECLRKMSKESKNLSGNCIEPLAYLYPWASVFYSIASQLKSTSLNERIKAIRETYIPKLFCYQEKLINGNMPSLPISEHEALLLQRYKLEYGNAEVFNNLSFITDPMVLSGTYGDNPFRFDFFSEYYPEQIAKKREEKLLDYLKTSTLKGTCFLLSHSTITDSDLEAICLNNTQIEVLKLEHCKKISLKGIQRVINILPNLASLFIRHLDKIKLIDFYSESSKLAYLEIASCYDLKIGLGLSNLSHLVLDGIKFNPFESVLKINNSNLRYLEIFNDRDSLKIPFREILKEVKDIHTLEMIKIPKCHKIKKKNGDEEVKDNDLYKFLDSWMQIFYPKNEHFYHNGNTPILERNILDLFDVIPDLSPNQLQFSEAFIETIRELVSSQTEKKVKIKLSASDFGLIKFVKVSKMNDTSTLGLIKPIKVSKPSEIPTNEVLEGQASTSEVLKTGEVSGITTALLANAMLRTKCQIISIDFSGAKLGNKFIPKFLSVLEKER